MESGNPCSLCMGSGIAASNQSDVPKAFSCHICLELPKNAVVTVCGHMFCWPCLHRWLQNQETQPCPVCNTVLRTGEIIPVYGGHELASATESSGDASNVPPRPNPLLARSSRAGGMEGSSMSSGDESEESDDGTSTADDGTSAAIEPGTDGGLHIQIRSGRRLVVRVLNF